MNLGAHKLALLTIASAAVLDAIGGWAFAVVEHLSVGTGLYWAITTATTAGYGDVVPHSWPGHLIAVLVMLTVVPLFSATFSLFTASLMKGHIDKRHEELKRSIGSEE